MLYKEEEAVVQRYKSERALVKKQIFDQMKKLKKLKNINERLKLTEEEKKEIERRIEKEVQCLRCFDSLLLLKDYVDKRSQAQSALNIATLEFEFSDFKQEFETKDFINDHLGRFQVTDNDFLVNT